MHVDPDYDDRELMDVPPDEPMGNVPTTINIPVPRLEQITGEIARQIIGSAGYKLQGDLHQLVRDAITSRVEALVAERADGIIRELMDRPIQKTDGYGNPLGAPTSLMAILTAHIEGWASEPVDPHGKARGERDGVYRSDKLMPRLAYFVTQCASADLDKHVKAEVAKVAAQLKEAAAGEIAKKIGAQVASLVIGGPR